MSSYLRIAGAVAAVAAIAFLWWRVQLSFSQGAELDAKDETISALNRAFMRDARTATAMADFRGEQATFNQAFKERLDAEPITREVVKYVDRNTGATVTCRERDPVRYRLRFNEAVTGTTGMP